jgi:lipopolysaccharide transport system ATP-binding protein
MLPAIRVEHLSKRYLLGERQVQRDSLRELMTDVIKAPLRRLKRLRGTTDDGWFWALDDLAFDVQHGEIVAVIGRNGAGKSTLLKLLSRIAEPTRGRIELRGRVASLLEVGTGFHPDLSGRENVFLNGAILGMGRREIRRKFDDIVEFAEVSRFIDTAVKHYSSGMYLRLAFAVAAHLDGEILLVDEVLAVGDVAFQHKCLGKIQDVGRGGRTVMFVTHNMSAAAALCQRGILIDGGRVAVDAGVQDAIKTYLGSGTSASQTWNVADVRRDHGRGERVRFTRIDALPRDPDGFRYREELRFRVHLSSLSTLSPIYVGAGIDDILGQRLATFESNEIQFSLDVESGCDYVCELRVPQPCLNPGRYFLSVSVFSGQIYYDALFHVAAFEILPIDVDSGDYFEPIPGAGALRLPYQWHRAEIAS